MFLKFVLYAIYILSMLPKEINFRNMITISSYILKPCRYISKRAHASMHILCNYVWIQCMYVFLYKVFLLLIEKTFRGNKTNRNHSRMHGHMWSVVQGLERARKCTHKNQIISITETALDSLKLSVKWCR